MKHFRSWLPVFVWMAVIFSFSGRGSVRVAEEPLLNFLFFKTLHVLEYSVLFILFVRALRVSIRFSNTAHVFVLAFLLTVFYAITDEIHQLFIPTREGRLRDVIIDAIGALLSWISIRHFLPKAPKKLRKWRRSLDII